MTGQLLTVAPPALDANADPYSGAKWYFYQSGTTTPLAVYADATLTISLGSVVTADSAGRFVPIYLDPQSLYRAVLKNATGSATVSDIDPVNTDTLSQLALDDGAGLIGFSHSAAYLSATAGLKAQQTVALSDAPFGAVGDGTQDDTSAVQDAFDFAMEHGKPIRDSGDMCYRLTGPIALSEAVDFEGVMPRIPFGVTAQVPDNGTRFLFDHTGVGLYGRNDGDVGIPSLFLRLSKFATYRPHSTPGGGGWSPTVCEEDIRCEHRMFIDNAFLINPYLGLKVRQNGNVWIGRMFGQPLHTGIEFERSSDIQNIDNLHFWPVWSQNSDVFDYTISNTVAMRVRRADGLRIGRVFSYGYAWTLDAQDVSGDTSGLAAFDIQSLYADRCGGGIRIRSDYYPAYGTFGSVVVNSDFAVGGAGAGIEIAGAVPSQISIGALAVSRAHEQALLAHEAAHTVNVSPYKVADWNRLAAGYYAFQADNGATISLLSKPTFSSTALLYNQGASGTINVGPMEKRRFALLDDTAIALMIPTIDKVATVVITPLTAPGSGIPSGSYWARCTASPSIQALPAGTTISNVDLATGPLTGTTGTDGHSRISAASDGKLYIENRTGNAMMFIVSFVGH